MSKRICKEEQIKLIMECRSSGLSDYQWCKQNGIHPGNFYNWVSKLRKSGHSFPEPASKSSPSPNIQEVVKMDFIPCTESMSSLMDEQNVSFYHKEMVSAVAAELLIGNVTVRLFNNADEKLIRNTLTILGGANNAW